MWTLPPVLSQVANMKLHLVTLGAPIQREEEGRPVGGAHSVLGPVVVRGMRTCELAADRFVFEA